MDMHELNAAPGKSVYGKGSLPLSPRGRDNHAAPLSEAKADLDSILVATDFAKHGTYAARRALMLADEAGMSSATLLHVLDERGAFSLTPFLTRSGTAIHERGDDARRQLHALADRARLGAGLAVECHVEAGTVVETIAAFAQRADLIVLGAEGAHPVRDFTLGSNAQRVLRKTGQPILAVRRRPDASYRQVLVGVDLATDPGTMFAYARTLAPHATLNVVHVYDVPHEGTMRYAGAADEAIGYYRAQAREEAMRKMTQLVLPRVSLSRARVSILHGYATAKLLEKERELNPDLVIVAKRDRPLAEELLVESVALQLLARSRSDVLVVR